MKYIGLSLIFIFLFSGCGTFQAPIYRSPSSTTSSSTPSSPPPSSFFSQKKSPIALQWPLKNPRVNQHFKHGAKRSRHQGIDLKGTRGTPVYSAHEGYVLYAGQGFRGFGKMIILENPQGYATFYAHLDRILAKEGQYLRTGHQIGTVGQTGRATGPHLHFELRISRRAVNPLDYLPKIGPNYEFRSR